MREGCLNFKSLYWSNPTVDYEIVECPEELKQHPPCWWENGGHWPAGKPKKCATGYGLFTNDEEEFTPIESVVETEIQNESIDSEQEVVIAEVASEETTSETTS